LDFLEQGGGQLAGDLLVGVGDQGIDAAEMMVEQTHGNPGLGGDAAHGNPGVPVTGQAAQGGGHQHFAAFVGLGAAVFRRRGCHKEFLGCGARLASLVERAFNLQFRPWRCIGF